MDPTRSTLRIVGLTVAAIFMSVACIALGLWQGQRTLDIVEAERTALSAPIPVLDAATVQGHPGESIGRPVTVQGQYIADGQRLIAYRSWQGKPGVWVVTPMAVGANTVAVLRGWVPSADSSAVAVPSGTVSVSGILQPFDDFYGDDVVLADGQFAAISRSALEQSWGTPAVSLVVVLTDQSPDVTPSPQPVEPAVRTMNVPFPLQNAAYTVQWFVFGLFVWFMWWLWLRRAPREDAAAPTADSLNS